MESSDDSFAWTDASSELSDMALDIKLESCNGLESIEICRNMILQEVDQIKKKAEKRKHTDDTDDRTFNPENNLDSPKNKRRKSEFLISNDLQVINSSVKLEQDLNLDPIKTKSKKKKKSKDYNESTIIKEETNESLDTINDSCLIYEDKQRLEAFVKPFEVKSKKNKNRVNQNECETRKDEADKTINTNESRLNYKVKKEDQLFENPTDTNPKKKKKYKGDQNEYKTDQEEYESSLDPNDSYQSYEVKQDMESLIVEPNETNTKKRKRLKEESMSREEESIVELSKKKSKKKNKLGNDENTTGECNYSTSIILDDTLTRINTDLAESHHREQKKKKRKHKDKFNEHITEENTEEHNLTNNNINQSCNNINESTSDSYLTDNHKNENKKKLSMKKKSSAENDISKVEFRKISERLKFEDEDSADSIIPESEIYEQQIQSKQLKLFIQSSKHLTPTLCYADTEHLMSEEDDVWIVKCPRELDLSALEEVKIPLDSKCKLKLDGKTYQGAYDDSVQRVPLVSYSANKYIVHNVPLNGFIRFRKRIPKVHIPNYNIMVNNQTNFISLPETKCRHPLLGINYKKASKIPQCIAERLSDKLSVCSETEMETAKEKRKKHKREKRKAEDEGERKNKRHHSKRIKREPHSPERWDSEQAIKNNLFGLE